jgi:hypothetical protein
MEKILLLHNIRQKCKLGIVLTESEQLEVDNFYKVVSDYRNMQRNDGFRRSPTVHFFTLNGKKYSFHSWIQKVLSCIEHGKEIDYSENWDYARQIDGKRFFHCYVKVEKVEKVIETGF